MSMTLERLGRWIKALARRYAATCAARPVAVCLTASLLINIILELLAHRGLLGVAQFIIERPFGFFYGVLVIFFTLTVALLLPKRAFGIGLIGCLWLWMGIVNFVLLSFRSTPFGGYDFLNIASGLDLIDVYMKPWQIALSAAGIAGFLALVVAAFRKCPREKVGPRMAAILAVSAALTAAATAGGTYFGLLPNKIANLPDAFYQNGFVYCFSRTLLDRGIKKPDDYGVKTIYGIVVEPDDGDGVIHATAKTNPDIIMVQLESFFNVNRMKDLTFSSQVIPNFTAFLEEYPSGLMTVPVVGAGTVNTEFEVLTGMSLDFFGAGEQPYRTVLRDGDVVCPSICYDLRSYGYTSTAIHNNDGTFYERHKVYPNLGFDFFISQEYMDNLSFNSQGWVRDACLTEQINKTLDATEGSDFIYTVSVQPHGKYPTEGDFDFSILTSGLGEDTERDVQFNYYISQMVETDAFVGALKKSLDTRGKPYILVLFGDHLPSLDIEDGELSTGDMFMTEYVIVTNTDLETEGGDLSAWQLSTKVMEMAGFEGGEIYRLHHDPPEDAEEYSHQLELLEYDLLYGDKIALGSEDPYEATDMRMGIDRITMSDCFLEEDGFYVTGENFTPFSVVYFDDDEVETLFIDKNTLYCPDADMKPDSQINVSVAQAGDNHSPLSFTNAIVFYTPHSEEK